MKHWGLVISAILLLVIAFVLGFILVWHTSDGLDRGLPTHSKRPLEAKRQYAVPIEKQGIPSLSAPKRHQVRGEIRTFADHTLWVEVTGELWELRIPDRVFVRCLPETLPGPDGNLQQVSEVFLDLSKASEKGTQVTSGGLPASFSTGDAVTVLVDENESGERRVDVLVGYGCTI